MGHRSPDLFPSCTCRLCRGDDSQAVQERTAAEACDEKTAAAGADRELRLIQSQADVRDPPAASLPSTADRLARMIRHEPRCQKPNRSSTQTDLSPGRMPMALTPARGSEVLKERPERPFPFPPFREALSPPLPFPVHLPCVSW